MNNRNILFFSLSIALHLGVFALLLEVTATELEIHSNSEQGSSALNISLLREDSHPHETAKKKLAEKSEPAAKTNTPITTKISSKIKVTDSYFLKNTSPSNTNELSTANIKGVSSESPDHLTINKILHDELSRHFYYPAVAQRRNWQGKVLIAFTVTSNGDITRIHINTSSGYKILDNAAIDALRKISAGDKFLRALNGHSIEKSLPIIYALASR